MRLQQIHAFRILKHLFSCDGGMHSFNSIPYIITTNEYSEEYQLLYKNNTKQ